MEPFCSVVVLVLVFLFFYDGFGVKVVIHSISREVNVSVYSSVGYIPLHIENICLSFKKIQTKCVLLMSSN